MTERPPRAPQHADGLADARDPESGEGDLTLGDVTSATYQAYLAELAAWHERRQAAAEFADAPTKAGQE